MRFKLLLILLGLTLSSYTKYVVPIADVRILTVSDSICNAEMGKREVTGRNDGKHITAYMKVCGLNGNKQYPYCAAGQAYCLHLACEQLGLPYPYNRRSAVANYYFDYAIKDGVKVEAIPAVNDFVVWRAQKGNTGHIERVKSVVNNNVVYTYAFNTSNGKDGDQREGNGNYIRKRHLNSFLGRLRLRGLVGYYPAHYK